MSICDVVSCPIGHIIIEGFFHPGYNNYNNNTTTNTHTPSLPPSMMRRSSLEHHDFLTTNTHHTPTLSEASSGRIPQLIITVTYTTITPHWIIVLNHPLTPKKNGYFSSTALPPTRCPLGHKVPLGASLITQSLPFGFTTRLACSEFSAELPILFEGPNYCMWGGDLSPPVHPSLSDLFIHPWLTSIPLPHTCIETIPKVPACGHCCWLLGARVALVLKFVVKDL